MCLNYFPVLAVHGVWEEWSPWSLCSFTCGRGHRTRTRVCTPPQHGGRGCDGPENQSKLCNIALCPGLFPSLSSSLVIDVLLPQSSQWASYHISLNLLLLFTSHNKFCCKNRMTIPQIFEYIQTCCLQRIRWKLSSIW